MRRDERDARPGLVERVYRLLMLSYPSEFRLAHAQDAAEVFGDLYRDERASGGMVAVLKLWGRTFVQLFSGGMKERWPSLERRRSGSTRSEAVAAGIPGSSPSPPPLRTPRASLGEYLRDVIADFQFTIRTAAKTPAFTLVVILTLALGIGATTAIFSVVNGVLLEPLPYEDPDELVIMYEQWSSFGTVTVAYPNFVDWREMNTSFEDLAAWNWTETNMTGVGDPVHLNACRVTASMFDILKVQPALGRNFTDEEGKVGGPAVTILSHGLWQSRFGSDPEIIGRVVSINDKPFTIVGIMPQEFVFPQLSSTPDLYLPIGQFAESWVQNRSNHPGIAVLGRLNPETSFERAVADMEAVAVGLEGQYPEHNTGSRVRMWPLYERLLGDIEPLLWILFSAVAFVLLIACVNVANLLLARGASREQEMAIRSALGAGGGRIVRLVMTESVVFWLCGSIVGVLLARAGTQSLAAWLAGSMPRAAGISIDADVLGFALVVSMITGLIFGLVPAFRSARMNLQEALKEGGRSTTGKTRSRTRRRLVIAELALAQALLVAAGLTIHSFALLVGADPGLEVQNLLTLRISLPEARYPELAERHAFFNQVRERVEGMPGVVSAAVGGPLPLSPKGGWQQGYYVEGEPLMGPGEVTLVEVAATSPEYHRTLGIPLLRGRTFGRQDATSDLRYVIVDETFVARHWPEKDPIGKRLIFGVPENEADLEDASWMEVVGVVGNVKNNGIANDSLVQMYIPFESDQDNTWSLAVRTEGDPLLFVEPIRAAVLELDPDQPISDVSTMAANLELTTVSNRMLSALLGTFATAALLLASIGIYGVFSHDTATRTHEIGIRMAVGASSSEVLRMVLRQALVMVGVGIAIGVVLSFVASRWLSAELFGVSPADPLTLIGAPLFLCAVAVVATLLPARRAARVDPLIALRSE